MLNFPLSLPAAGGCLEPLAAPAQLPRAALGGRGELLPHPNPRSVPLACAHTRAPTHRGMHTKVHQAYIHPCRFSDASHWLDREQSPGFVGSNKGFQARPVVKAVNFKGKGFSDCFRSGSCRCCLTKAFPLFTLGTFGAH